MLAMHEFVRSRFLYWSLTATAVAGISVLVAGCSGTSLPYPKTSDFKAITQKILSPAEQEKAISELSEQKEKQQGQPSDSEATASQ